MNKQKIVLALLMSLLMSTQTAEASILKKCVHVVKKTIVLPIYLAGGVVGGVVFWWHLGGYEDDIRDAFRGQQ